MKKQLVLIDNNFFAVPFQIARQLADKKLPKVGYEKLIDLNKLVDFELVHSVSGEIRPYGNQIRDAKKAYLLRTSVNAGGSPVTGGWTWALRFRF